MAGERDVASDLLRCAAVLGDAGELLGDIDRLAEVQAEAAVRRPALYMALVNHYVLCLNAVVSFGMDDACLGPCRAALEGGVAKGVFLVTEVGRAGSHLGARTTAAFDFTTREFVLDTPDADALKFSSVTPEGPPTYGAVVARAVVEGVDRGTFVFLVDLTDGERAAPGVEISGPLTASALPLAYGLIRFRNCRVPYGRWLSDGAWIDSDGRFTDPSGSPGARLRRTMSVGQALWATVPSAMAAMARRAALSALRFAQHRTTPSGAPLLGHVTHQRALLGALAGAYALSCSADAALRAWRRKASGSAAPEGALSPWVAVDASLALLKAVSTQEAVRVVEVCRRHCGLAGFLDVNLLEGYLGAAQAFTVAGGDNALIFVDTGRAGAGAGGEEPVIPGEFTDPAWWPSMARAHELRLAADAVPGDLVRLKELGEAAGATLIARALTGHPLGVLHGLLEADRAAGRLVATGVLTPEGVRALPKAIDRLCAELMARLSDLISEFETQDGTPPLGAPDYATALWDHFANSLARGSRTTTSQGNSTRSSTSLSRRVT
ncbi:acyl-CoA oxidase [Streptomyces niveiscabiei]|uniref:acyl-CoA dehydrogenase family protein n=1 Tax=Streptomyces niveiscabiei TaxID=164115 RepID=UPI0029BD5EF5|nr:acyl-CoA oxidase [Streptomyces niveiscabiei]MDX3382415.1 acyl-CoA oxidase [Streptomyces niveiscabiei]